MEPGDVTPEKIGGFRVIRRLATGGTAARGQAFSGLARGQVESVFNFSARYRAAGDGEADVSAWRGRKPESRFN